MKAASRPAPPNMTASGCSSSVRSGKVAKPKDTEDSEVTMYMEKLHFLIPSSKGPHQASAKLSKLEVIERVIQYIAQLEDVLEVSHQKDMDMLECKTSSIALTSCNMM